jgi:hypothetical protein
MNNSIVLKNGGILDVFPRAELNNTGIASPGNTGEMFDA